MATPNAEACPRVRGMPALGLGTWQNTDHEQCAESVRTALEVGYRHVDTAQMYENEAAVGEGIARSEVDREDVFLATKVWFDRLAYDDVIASTERSLDRLGVEYVDVLYVHWPVGDYDPEETLPAFDELRDRGLIDHVGVSNFDPDHLDRARDVLDAPIAAHQVECHPFFPQEELRAYADAHDHALVAYSPLARGSHFDHPAVADVANKHDASPPQVFLSWLRAKDVVAIPKATGREHIVDNWRSLELELDEEDVDRIDGIEERERQGNPPFAPW